MIPTTTDITNPPRATRRMRRSSSVFKLLLCKVHCPVRARRTPIQPHLLVSQILVAILRKLQSVGRQVVPEEIHRIWYSTILSPAPCRDVGPPVHRSSVIQSSLSNIILGCHHTPPLKTNGERLLLAPGKRVLCNKTLFARIAIPTNSITVR